MAGDLSQPRRVKTALQVVVAELNARNTEVAQLKGRIEVLEHELKELREENRARILAAAKVRLNAGSGE